MFGRIERETVQKARFWMNEYVAHTTNRTTQSDCFPFVWQWMHWFVADNKIKENLTSLTGQQCIKQIRENTAKSLDVLFCITSSNGNSLKTDVFVGYLLAYLFQSHSSIRCASVQRSKHRIFVIAAANFHRFGFLSIDDAQKQNIRKIEVSVELQLIAIGLRHICVTFNNHIWCYSFDSVLLFEYDFISEVQSIEMNAIHCAALVDYKIFVIDVRKIVKNQHIKPFVFGPKNEKIFCFSLTPLFLICVSKNGILCRLCLEVVKHCFVNLFIICVKLSLI